MNTRHLYTRRGSHSRCGRRALTLALCLCATAVLATPGSWTPAVRGQEADAVTALEAKLDQKGTIVMRDATLVEWLFAIQREWGVDIVVGNELQRDVVNGAFTDATLREVLTAILYARGYGYRQIGKSLMITRLDDMTIKPNQRNAIIPLEFLTPEEVLSSVQLLLSQDGKVEAVPSSRSLFVIDSPAAIESVRRFVRELEEHAKRSYESAQEQLRAQQAIAGAVSGADVPAGTEEGAPNAEILELEEHTKVYRLQYVAPENMADVIGTVLPGARATPLLEDGKLVVTADARSLTAVEDLIAQIDIPRKQVRITAYMYDVNVEVMERLGFNWSNSGRGRIDGSGDPNSLLAVNANSFQGSSVDTSGMTPAAAAVATAASTSVGSLFTLGHFSRHFDLSSTIQALETTDGSRLLARPNIVAYDLVKAEFQSVQEIPVQQLTQTEAGGNIGTTEFREAGITLAVTPRIMEDDSILVEVTPAFSVLNGFNNGQPIIDRRQATTTLSLLNGQAAVIGGLVRRNEIETDGGVPGILHWKYLGRLFRGHEASVTESELVVFIRAEIIETSHPGEPRDQAAHSTLEELLNRIPYSNPAPVVGSCGDPYCPLHNPRPRHYGEHPVDYKCTHDHKHPVQTYSSWDPHTVQGEPFEPTPAVNMNRTPAVEPILAPDVTTNRTPAIDTGQQPSFSTSQPPSVETGQQPSVETGQQPSVDTIRPPHVDTGQPTPPALNPEGAPESPAIPPYNAEEDAVHIPPPVIIDEMARRYRSGQAVMSRLPSVNGPVSLQAERVAPIVVRPNRQAAAPTSPSRALGERTPPAPQPRTASPTSRKNWLENLFQR